MTDTHNLDPEEYTRCVECREVLLTGEEINVDGFIPVCSEKCKQQYSGAGPVGREIERDSV